MALSPLPKHSALRRNLGRYGIYGLMALLVVLLGLRVSEIAQDIAGGHGALVRPVRAEDAKAEGAATDTPKKEAKPDAKPDVKAEANPAADVKADAKAETKTEAKLDAVPNADAVPDTPPDNYTEAEVTILKSLSQRRQELEKRARALDQREALLTLSEQRVDKKVADLTALQDKVRAQIGEVNAQRQAQIASMVKIYETMKPKDAAGVLETMDIGTLMALVGKMKEAKVAPILGAMNPVKAKELTTALVNQRPLPTPP